MAGLPRGDARGRITIHRARSTMASELYNARNPWPCSSCRPGSAIAPRSRRTTTYIQITPTRLARAYVEAGDFTQNLRTIEVLIDREAVHSGSAATGTAWQCL